MTQEPLDLSIAAFSLPDDADVSEVPVSTLPRNWMSYPAPPELADIGTEWVCSRGSLLLLVPSAVVPDEPNVLINPEHQDIVRFAIEDVRAFAFDQRLLDRLQ